MEITKREILASITIIALMLLIGVLLQGQLVELKMDANEKYNKAVKIESQELFRYGMDTNIGYAFVYGDLIALDPVSYPEIDGEYLSIEKVKERYTMHTRTVTYTVDGKTKTRTETYWTWDVVGRENKQAKRVEFKGIEFDSNKFNLPSESHLTTIKTSSHVRYKYYVSSTEHTGTIFGYLANKDIEGNKVDFYKGLTIDETTEMLDSNVYLIIFWMFWIVLTGFAVYFFYYAENRWLH